MITTTVGELIDFLSKYDRNQAVVKHDPDRTGYTAINLIAAMEYHIEINPNPQLGVDFIDQFKPSFFSFNAIVL